MMDTNSAEEIAIGTACVMMLGILGIENYDTRKGNWKQFWEKLDIMYPTVNKLHCSDSREAVDRRPFAF